MKVGSGARILYSILIVLAGSISKSLAQVQLPLQVNVSKYENGKTCKGCLVNVYSGDELHDSQVVSSKKGLTFQFSYGKMYKIEITSPGRVKRFFYLDLTSKHLPEPDLLEKRALNIKVQLTLFIEKEGVDYSFILNNPITTFYLNEDATELTFDRSQAEITSSKVVELTK